MNQHVEGSASQQPRIIRRREVETYWDIVKRQFYKYRTGVWSLRILIVLIFVAVFADFLANDMPVFCIYRGTPHFPIIQNYLAKLGVYKLPPEFVGVSFKDLEYDFVIFPPVPYSPTNVDYSNRYVGPFDEQDVPSFRWRHFLGTNELGKDVLSGLIHGTRYALSVGVLAMSIASIIGIVLGGIAGFFGDTGLKLKRITLLAIFMGGFLGFFWGFMTFQMPFLSISSRF